MRTSRKLQKKLNFLILWGYEHVEPAPSLFGLGLLVLRPVPQGSLELVAVTFRSKTKGVCHLIFKFIKFDYEYKSMTSNCNYKNNLMKNTLKTQKVNHSLNKFREKQQFFYKNLKTVLDQKTHFQGSLPTFPLKKMKNYDLQQGDRRNQTTDIGICYSTKYCQEGDYSLAT